MFSLCCKPFVCPTSQIGDTAILSPPDHHARQVGTMGHHWDGLYSLRQGCVLLAGAATCINHFCRDKRFVATNTCLSRQNTSFVPTKVYLSRQTRVCCDKYNFVATKVLSRQAYKQKYACRDQHVFVSSGTECTIFLLCSQTTLRLDVCVPMCVSVCVFVSVRVYAYLCARVCV